MADRDDGETRDPGSSSIWLPPPPPILTLPGDDDPLGGFSPVIRAPPGNRPLTAEELQDRVYVEPDLNRVRLLDEVGIQLLEPGQTAADLSRPPGAWESWPCKQIGEAIYEVREPEWVVDGLFAKGSLIMLAGKPKKGRKSLISIYMAVALARGLPLFGLPVKQGLKVMMLNLEDGYQRVLRRFRDYGVQPGDLMPLRILAVDGEYLRALELIKRDPPDVLFIDPLMELELMAGVKNENDSNQVAALLKPIRDLARMLAILIFLLHHFGVDGKRARGSSALEGSTDGWINSNFIEKKGVQRLGWTLRDADDGYVDLKIDYQPGNVRIDIDSAPVFGTTGEITGRNKDSDDDDEGGGKGALVTQSAKDRAEQIFKAASEPLTRDMLREISGISNNVVTEIMRQFAQDSLIRKNGRRWEWNWTDEEKAAELASGPAPVDLESFDAS